MAPDSNTEDNSPQKDQLVYKRRLFSTEKKFKEEDFELEKKVAGSAELIFENKNDNFLGGVYFCPTPPMKNFISDPER